MNEKYEEAVEFYKNNKNYGITKTAKLFNINDKNLGKILKERNLTRNIGSPKYDLDVNYFNSIDNKYKAYWIGFILADGCLCNNIFKLTLSEKDEEHLKKFLKYLNSNIPIKKEKRSFDGALIQFCLFIEKIFIKV